jgi:hypothetical protein
MKKLLYVFLCLSVLLTACGTALTSMPTATVPVPTGTPAASATPQPPTETATPQPSPTVFYPAEGYGPSNFPTNLDPLTGLQVADPALLVRRPLLIKVSNLPRNQRPQWGLSQADLVFEYYSEEGGTRLAGVFYGNNASMVGPIRSGRFIDIQLVRGYKAVFAFGYAYIAEWNAFVDSEFVDRLVVEGATTPLTRYDPNGANFLVVDTAKLSTYAAAKGINQQQNLDGMSFNLSAPSTGTPVNQVFVRYSAVIYNRWDYDAVAGKYLRYSDIADDFDGTNEQYAQLTDRLTNQPIAFDNVVVLYVNNSLYSTDSKGNNIYDIQLIGSGDGYAFRDGQACQVRWQRNNTDVVSLTNLDGTPFPFKPGATWFEVVGLNSTLKQSGSSWRFTHNMP